MKGRKLSRSSKTFSTIKEYLGTYTARQFRMLFLLHSWHTTMNYDAEDSFPEAIKKEKEFAEFFKNVKATLRQCNVNETR